MRQRPCQYQRELITRNTAFRRRCHGCSVVYENPPFATRLNEYASFLTSGPTRTSSNSTTIGRGEHSFESEGFRS